MSNLNEENIAKINTAIPQTKSPVFQEDRVEVLKIEENPITVQISKRGPSFSKVLDTQGHEIAYVTSLSIGMSAGDGWPELTLKILNPKIEVIE